MKKNIIIGISGTIGSGKDTVADYLVTFHGFKRLSFASSLKDAVASIFGWDRTLLEGSTRASREWREQVDVWWADRLGIPYLTPRYILQQWGTDVLRSHFHDEIWVASLENRLRNTTDDVVITDCRFSNEVTAIKNAGGITIRANRGPTPSWYDLAIKYNDGDSQAALTLDNLGIHASEYSSVGLDYDHQLDNNGSIDDLHQRILGILDLTR